MTETTSPESVYIRIPRAELEGAREAIRHYMFSFIDGRNHAWGQGEALAWRESSPGLSWMWMYLWYGFNHLKIEVGDTVRVSHPTGDEPEFSEATVLTATTFAALVDDEVSGVSWEIWPSVHRMDRLYTEPEFDTTHHVPVCRHMGHDVDPESAAEYDASVAASGTTSPNLSIVKDGNADE